MNECDSMKDLPEELAKQTAFDLGLRRVLGNYPAEAMKQGWQPIYYTSVVLRNAALHLMEIRETGQISELEFQRQMGSLLRADLDI